MTSWSLQSKLKSRSYCIWLTVVNCLPNLCSYQERQVAISWFPTKVIALQLLLLVRGFSIATEKWYILETSISTFLIACYTSYQICVNWHFYVSWLLSFYREFSWRQQRFQWDSVSLNILMLEGPMPMPHRDLIEIYFYS